MTNSSNENGEKEKDPTDLETQPTSGTLSPNDIPIQRNINSVTLAPRSTTDNRGFFSRLTGRFPFGKSNHAALSPSPSFQGSAIDSPNGKTPVNGTGLVSQAGTSKADLDAIIAENKDRHRWAKTLPPWIHSVEEGELERLVDDAEPSSLPREPPATEPAKHLWVPEENRKAVRGRHFDHVRSGEAVMMSTSPLEHTSRWLHFARASAYPRRPSQEGEIVDEKWMKENLPDLDEPWSPEPPPTRTKDQRFWLFSPEKRSATVQHFQRILMKNPFVPLIIRVTVLTYCAAALGLGASIYHKSELLNGNPKVRQNTNSVSTGEDAIDYICTQQTSTYMAFIVDSCAVIYLGYITWDEYFSKPLGLRRSRDKMRLLFLDLLFIAFSAANLSLAFNTLTDQQWACYDGSPQYSNSNNAAAAVSTCVENQNLCNRQKGLVSVLLIAVVTWVMTFAISVLRVVERISR